MRHPSNIWEPGGIIRLIILYSLFGIAPVLLLFNALVSGDNRFVFLLAGGLMGLTALAGGVYAGRLKELLLLGTIFLMPVRLYVKFYRQEEMIWAIFGDGFAISIADIPLFILYALWFWEVFILRSRRIIFKQRWVWFMLATLLVNSLSMLASKNMLASSFFVFAQVKALVFLLYFLNNVTSERQLRFCIYALAITLAFHGLVGIEQHFLNKLFNFQFFGFSGGTQDFLIGEEMIARVSGLIGHPNRYAMFLNLLLPVCITMLLVERRNLYRLILLGCIGCGALALLFSMSRGGWLGLSVSLCTGFFLLLLRRYRNPLQAGFITIAIISVLGASLLASSETLRTRLFKEDHGTSDVRIPLNFAALGMIRDNPLLGVGPNTFILSLAEYDRHTQPLYQVFISLVHNTFLLIAAEMGIPSMLLFIALILTGLWQSLRVFWKYDGFAGYYALGLFMVLLCWSLHNMVNFNFPHTDYLFWMLLAMLTLAERNARKSSETPAA